MAFVFPSVEITENTDLLVTPKSERIRSVVSVLFEQLVDHGPGSHKILSLVLEYLRICCAKVQLGIVCGRR